MSPVAHRLSLSKRSFGSNVSSPSGLLDSEYHSHCTSCVPAVMTEVIESPDVIQLLVLRALSLARKVALSWVPGEATGPSLALILSCRDFPIAGYDPSSQHSCPVSVTIPARLHSSSSMGLRLGTPQPLLLPVACGGLGHLCNSPILCPEAAF